MGEVGRKAYTKAWKHGKTQNFCKHLVWLKNRGKGMKVQVVGTPARGVREVGLYPVGDGI